MLAFSVSEVKFLHTSFFLLSWHAPPHRCDIAWVTPLSLSVTPVNQLRRQLGVISYFKWHYFQPEVGVLVGKTSCL